MNLKHLSNMSLRKDAKTAALKEKEATAALLHYIKEVDRRKLFCDWKFTSLFDWCVNELGLCEGSAQLRITAARLMEDIPEIENKIEEGSLTLTNISQVNRFCRQNQIDDLEEKKVLLKQVENLSKKEAEKKIFEITGATLPAYESQKRVSKDHKLVSLVLSDETMKMLDEAKDLLGKEVDSDELIQLMAQALIEKIEKEKFKQVSKPQAANVVKGRAISAQVKREVYKRDKACVNCGSRRNLNFDHRIAYSLGGGNSVENIRLLCFHCNQRAWKITGGGFRRLDGD